MATYTLIQKSQAAVGTASSTVYSVATANSAVLTGGTVSNILSDPVTATIIVNNGTTDINRVYQAYLNPGDTMNPLAGSRWVLTGGTVLKVKASVQSAVDVMFDGVEVTP